MTMPAALALRHAAHLAWSSSCNVVWDGNSLVAGQGATGGQTVVVQTDALSPLSGSGVAAATNVGIGGQTWAQMNSAATDVDGAWVGGKTNVLILWEHTNSICNSPGMTGAQSVTNMATYIAARRAVHPWVVVVLTTLPREFSSLITDQTTRDDYNARMVAADALVMGSPSTYGVDAVVDVRQAGSPFAFTSYTAADFNNTAAYWAEASGSRVHLNNTGYGVVAGYVANVLKLLPRNAY